MRKLIETEATLSSLISQGEDLKDEVAQAVQGQDVAAAAPLQDLQRNTQTAEGAAAEVALVQDLRTSGAAGIEMELKHEERARQAGFAAIQEGLTLKEVQETVRQALHSEGSSLPDQESSAAIIGELTGAATWFYQARDKFAPNEEIMGAMRNLLSASENIRWDHWEKEARQQMTITDGDVPPKLPSPCQGVAMSDTKHKAIALSYVDDVHIGLTRSATGTQYQRTIGSLQAILAVLTVLDEHGIRLAARKTSFLRRRLYFLGWEVSEAGVRAQDHKLVAAIHKMDAECKSPSAVKSVLGSINFFRQLIPNASELESTLFALVKKDVKYKWIPDIHGTALSKIKDILNSAAILTPYDPEGGRPVVCADTSQTSCGACLSQECLITGAELVCSYQSIQLTDSQRKLSASEREMLGCKWALERFAPLIGNGKRCLCPAGNSNTPRHQSCL